MQPREIKVGDVVQIAPSDDTFFGACFMTVTEPKPWGAQGFIAMPGKRGEVPGQAFYRANWDDMEYIGAAEWVAS